MRKILLTLTLTFQIGILVAQKTQSELIIGTWRFEKECDLRTDKEKSEFEDVDVAIDPIETENGTGYADRTFNENGTFEFYYNKIQSTIGNFEFKNRKLICWRLIPLNQIKEKPKATKYLLDRKLIIKKKDGNYYFNGPIELKIKSIAKNSIEFGTEKRYSIWKRIK